MSKSILVIDTPENCCNCPLLNGSDECSMQDQDANFAADCFDDLAQGCPLKEIPEKEDLSETDENYIWSEGWNACIDAILGGLWREREICLN